MSEPRVAPQPSPVLDPQFYGYDSRPANATATIADSFSGDIHFPRFRWRDVDPIAPASATHR